MLGILDTPIRYGTLEATNRFWRSATHLYSADEDGTPNAVIERWYRELTEGGVGVMVSGYTYVTPEGQSSPRQIGIHEDRFVPHWERLLAGLDGPTRVLLQLGHGGRQVRYEVSGGRAIAPSAIPCGSSYGTEPAAMTSDDLRRVREAFVDGAARAMRAGFHGVQLHAAHGFLLSQFLSPFANRRADAYGGDTGARARFVVEIIDGIRQQLGDLSLTIKLNSTDGHPDGLQVDEAVEIGARLAQAGLDAIEVSGGSAEASQGATRAGPLEARDEGYYLDSAARIKAAAGIPVIATGGFRTLAVMRGAVEAGRVDAVGLCRPFIRARDLVRRFRDGLERSECDSCNGCYTPPDPVGCKER